MGKNYHNPFEIETMVIYVIIHGDAPGHPVLEVTLHQQTYEVLCSSAPAPVLLLMDTP